MTVHQIVVVFPIIAQDDWSLLKIHIYTKNDKALSAGVAVWLRH